jgi:hypothetical protein
MARNARSSPEGAVIPRWPLIPAQVKAVIPAHIKAVIPAQAGIHVTQPNMDPRLRGDDG